MLVSYVGRKVDKLTDQTSGENTNTYHYRVSECQVPADGMTSFTNQSQISLTAQQRKAPSQGSYAQRSTSGQELHGSRTGPSLQHSRGPSSWTTLVSDYVFCVMCLILIEN